jgi:hypothetical protein
MRTALPLLVRLHLLELEAVERAQEIVQNIMSGVEDPIWREYNLVQKRLGQIARRVRTGNRHTLRRQGTGGDR